MYCTITLLSPPYSSLSYGFPSWWPEVPAMRQTGLRVAVPLGNGALRCGIVLAIQQTAPELPRGVQLRELAFPLETAPLFSEQYIAMITQLGLRYCCTSGHILGHVLPQGLRTTKVRLRHFADGKVQLYTLKALQKLDAPALRSIGNALAQGKAEILPPDTDIADSEMCHLHAEPPWPVRPMAKRQIAILEYLLQHGNRSRRTLLEALGNEAQSALTVLVERGFVTINAVDDAMQPECDATDNALLPPPAEPFELSHDQQQALAAFQTALDNGRAVTHLLFGVTGSGKTAVYLALARLCHARGRNMLLLAPEVALALKLQRDASLALPHIPIFLYHGYQSAQRRERLYRTLAAQTQPYVVIGTRSALFLPMSNIGIIAMDEEHDTSFKQEESFTYQAKEVAWFLSTQHRSLLVLGSATPDIKTYYAAQHGHIPLQSLPQRVGGGQLPEVKLVDISRQNSTDALLAPESLQAIKDTVHKGEQVVILLNRRGYAPLMYCLHCNQVAKCPHCDISLTYHKSRQRLVCHYCGYTTPFPALCPNCKGMHYLPMGGGTEKLAESLIPLVDGKQNVLRLDKDSTRHPDHMESILQAFARQEAQILVGTQMLSKGHHFPNVTLAVVADGDLGLNLPDYRAAERTFQLLVQAAGRAGRGEKAGHVYIQTRNADHYCWQYIQHNDYTNFYEAELARREKNNYPPFVHLALIRISYALDYADGPQALAAIAATLKASGRLHQVTVRGPSPAPRHILCKRKRFNCLLKSHHWHALRDVFSAAADVVDKRFLRISLDLDPVNML